MFTQLTRKTVAWEYKQQIPEMSMVNVKACSIANLKNATLAISLRWSETTRHLSKQHDLPTFLDKKVAKNLSRRVFYAALHS